MTYEIIDVSDNNPYLTALPNGVVGIIAKSSEGNYHTDRQFTRYLDQYHGYRDGVPFAAYHFVTADDVTSQVDRIASVVPTSVTVCLDVEQDGAQSTAEPLAAALRARGYRVGPTYYPRWFWSQVGKPDISLLEPIWASNYTDATVGWKEYGGASIIGLQFTDNFGGYDASSFDDISFMQVNSTSDSVSTGDDDMPALIVPAGTDEHVVLPVDGCTKLFVCTGFDDEVTVTSLFWFGPTPDQPAPAYGPIGDAVTNWVIDANRPGPEAVPNGAEVAVIRYNANHFWTLSAK